MQEDSLRTRILIALLLYLLLLLATFTPLGSRYNMHLPDVPLQETRLSIIWPAEGAVLAGDTHAGEALFAGR